MKLWEENVKLVCKKTLCFMKKTRKDALPYLEAVAITFYLTNKVVFNFIQGKLDFTSGLDPSYKDDILTQRRLQPKYKDKVSLITGPISMPNIWAGMDGDNKAVLDLRIRQAMNYGFDRQK
jgi:peptide/nickel transport system substrate-binding protein